MISGCVACLVGIRSIPGSSCDRPTPTDETHLESGMDEERMQSHRGRSSEWCEGVTKTRIWVRGVRVRSVDGSVGVDGCIQPESAGRRVWSCGGRGGDAR